MKEMRSLFLVLKNLKNEFFHSGFIWLLIWYKIQAFIFRENFILFRKTFSYSEKNLLHSEKHFHIQSDFFINKEI